MVTTSADGDPLPLWACVRANVIEVNRRLIEERSAGNAILVISEDLDEVLALSDRVAVMFEGQIVAVMDVAEATVERVGLLMAGSEIVAEVS